jgi:hypothetical protein
LPSDDSPKTPLSAQHTDVPDSAMVTIRDGYQPRYKAHKKCKLFPMFDQSVAFCIDREKTVTYDELKSSILLSG